MRYKLWAIARIVVLMERMERAVSRSRKARSHAGQVRHLSGAIRLAERTSLVYAQSGVATSDGAAALLELIVALRVELAEVVKDHAAKREAEKATDRGTGLRVVR